MQTIKFLQSTENYQKSIIFGPTPPPTRKKQKNIEKTKKTKRTKDVKDKLAKTLGKTKKTKKTKFSDLCWPRWT